jgi:hypothetical protein
MPTPDATDPPSLMPYLNPCIPGIGLRLDTFETASESSAPDGAGQGPPFTTMRNGQIVFDGHSVITDIMMLSQADGYGHASSELVPLTNLDVEKSWQKAWQKMQDLQDGDRVQRPPLILPSQLAPDGGLKPVRPIFYCRQKERYAHAVCPFCGGALDLCREDGLLEAAGLAAYSASLERYLLCPACHQGNQEALFYRSEVPEEAPARVQGCKDLLVDYSRLLTRSDLAQELPCIGCDEAAACYGDKTAVLKRMIPLQFYPFHMFLLKAPTLNALDFLPLLGGAPVDTVQTTTVRFHKHQRAQLLKRFSRRFAGGSGLLFASEPQRFLEVLYLKLAFLHALWVLILDGASGPVNRMSMEGIGLNLAGQGARLPFLWNFSLQLIDPVGRPAAGEGAGAGPRYLAGEFLGLAWHYVLLVNAAQPMTKVQTALDNLRPDGVDRKDPAQVPDAAVFAPGNLFWDASDLELAPDAMALWEQTLDLGRQLLQPGFLASQPQAAQELEKRLAELKQRVRQDLFQAQAATGADRKVTAETVDGRIADIMESILNRWSSTAMPDQAKVQADETQQEISSPGRQPNEDGDVEETVILTTTDAGFENRAAAVDPALEKTVAIAPTPGSGPKIEAALERTVAASGPASPAEDPHLAETVVIKNPVASSPSDDIEKTVVLSPPGTPDGGERLEKTVIIDSTPKAADAEDLEETMLQPHAHAKRPSSAAGPVPVNPPETREMPPEDADDLEATVVLKPKAGKDRKPKS